MLKHTAITEKRIHANLSQIKALIYPDKAPIDLAAWHVGGEPVAFETALQAAYTPFAVGEKWGPSWDTAWFRVRGQVPQAWAGRKVVVLMRLTDSGGEGFTAEGLIYQNGQVTRALNINRSDIDVAAKAKGGEAFEFYVEGASNVAVRWDAVNNMGGSKTPAFQLVQAEMATFNQEAFDYYYDFKVASELMEALPADSQRRGELLYALNESLNRLDLGDVATLPAAREALADVLARKNGDTVHTLSAIGHAHIDTAWLWPLRESIRKCARTFSTAVDYMGRYPEYVFGCSQAQQYAWMKQYYPSIYEGIRKHIANGQWEPIGSMWVEADANLISGESLIRQIVYGKRYFKEEFGYETKDAWIPDVFGYSAALPQIYTGCGIDTFITQKISWSQFNKFPHHTFLWEGIDGTRIFSHFPPADTYNAEMSPKHTLFNVSNFREQGRATRSLYIYGFGDGGGGPSITMLEQARRMRNLEGLPKVELEKVADFCVKAKADARDLPVWVGELYLEFHRGTYTTHARNKRGNRKAEFLLRDAEGLDAVSLALVPDRKETAADPQRAVYDVVGMGAADANRHARALERAWKLLLLNQFHDIIPGSSITWVYKDSDRDYATIGELGQSVIGSSLGALNSKIATKGFQAPVQVLNTLGFEREEVVELAPGKLATVRVPSFGYTVVDAANAATFAQPAHAVTVEKANDGITISNGLIKLQIGEDGSIHRFTDLEAGGREVLATGGKGNQFQLHRDDGDAWDIDAYYKELVENLDALDRIEVTEATPLRAVVRIERSFGKSRLAQNLVVKAGSKRVDFETEADWHEEHKLLKVAFPVNVRSARATYEIQFGHIERPTHYNTSWDLARFEVCAHKWADLSEADYGVALLNDCKYGHDILDNVMRLSLLRAPQFPDPVADQGAHRFTYSILPHQGDLQHGRVIEEACQLNVPVRVTPLPVQEGPLPVETSFFKTDRPGILIDTVKPAEDGNGIIVRFYEAYGTRGAVTFQTTLPVGKISRADMLENVTEELEARDGAVRLSVRPFEIVTLRLSK